MSITSWGLAPCFVLGAADGRQSSIRKRRRERRDRIFLSVAVGRLGPGSPEGLAQLPPTL